MFVEKGGIVYELNPNKGTGKVKYSDCMIQEAKIEAKIENCIIDEIASKAFYYDEKLKSIYIPDTIKKIKNSCFEGCKRLSIINQNCLLNAENVGYYAFKGCKIKKITFTNLKTLGKGAFKDCSELIIINLPEHSISVLEEEVISDCSSLQEFTFPNSIKKAKNNFANCNNLKKIVFNNPALDVLPFISNIDKNVILFGDQDSEVQKVALYGFNFMLKQYMH